MNLRHRIGTAKRYLRLLREAELDARRYFRYSTTNGYHPEHKTAQRESEIMRVSHSIEKSLSMPDFRPRAAQPSVRLLISFLADESALRGVRQQVIDTAHAVLAAYQAHNQMAGEDVSDLLEEWNPPQNLNPSLGGARPWQPADPADAEAFQRFFRFRHSLRNFDPSRPADPAAIERAIDLARHAPSVCNRQTWRVHTFNGDKVQQILALQNGNCGFGHTIPTLLIITSDLRYFTGVEERYQPWIEGGIYSMALILALHSSDIASIPLNWSVLPKTDNKLHQNAYIPDYECVTTLIGCGYPLKKSLSPISARTQTF